MLKTISILLVCGLIASCNLLVQHYSGDESSAKSTGISRAPFVPLERPTPQESFILPVQGQESIYEGNLQEDYPDVNWMTLDRLYIPAGTYRFMQLKNLPRRSADRPLIITNYGGQVKFTGDHYYCVSLQGGSGWIFTGKYDAAGATGDAAYPGHLNGQYADSPGRYGIFIDQVRSSGVAVGGGASHFELEYLEISRVGFAGLSLKTDGAPEAHMHSLSIHDLYIHDSESEGVYIGNTSKDANAQHGFSQLKFYNNRLIRSGTEGPQFSHMGEGVEIHHNVFFLNAQRWKDPFMIYQDGCLQYMARNGKSSIHHNLFIGGASALFTLRFIASDEDSMQSGDGVAIYENYFSHSRNWLSYIHIDSSNSLSSLNFHNNFIQNINYHLNELPVNTGELDPHILFRNTNNRQNPLIFQDNRWEGEERFLQWIPESTGAQIINEDNTLFTGNQNLSFDTPVFLNVVLPGGEEDYSKVEAWVSYSELYEFYLSYLKDDLVVYQGNYYRCLEDYTCSNSSFTPDLDSQHWEDCGTVGTYDDLRLSASGYYGDMGLLY